MAEVREPTIDFRIASTSKVFTKPSQFASSRAGRSSIVPPPSLHGSPRLNAILYRIALTQAHHSPEARMYLARRVAEGKTKREAIRALKRFIVRMIWRLWEECRTQRLEVPVEIAA